MSTQKLRLGLLLDSFDVPAWVQHVIRRVISANDAEFVLVVLNGEKSRSIKINTSTVVYSIFNAIDKSWCTKDPDPFALKNIAELFSNTAIIKVFPIDNNCLLDAPDIAVIKEYQLDILLKFGFESLQFEKLDISKFGVWFYYHGDDRIMRGGPPGFWEVVENWSETGSALLAAGGKFSPACVLFRSCFVTYPLSPARHRSYYFWATTSFMARQISLLKRLGEEKYSLEIEKYNKAPLREIKNYSEPSNLAAVFSIGKIILRLFREFTHRLFYADQWFLLFSLNQGMAGSLSDFNNLISPAGKFWADPHTIQINDKYYIFVEEFLQAKNKGHISVIELDKSGNWKEPVKVLEKEYHLSYPFIFDWDGKFYMVPESRGNKSIDLYECVDFPYKWDFKQRLMENVSAVDTTLIHYSNRWWLFTAMAEDEAAAPNVELFLFYTDELFGGQWMAHPQNPIVSDVKCARPAGSLFVKEGKLFRPSQDCSKAYGYGFDLNEVELLSVSEYRERKALSIRPGWDKKILATHTFANCGDLTVIDVFRQTLKFR